MSQSRQRVGCADVGGGLGGGSRGSGGHEQTTVSTTLSNLFDLSIAYVYPRIPRLASCVKRYRDWATVDLSSLWFVWKFSTPQETLVACVF